MWRRADEGATAAHAISRKCFVLFVLVVYTMAILGQYFLLDTGRVENAAHRLQERMLRIEIKNKQLLTELESLTSLDDSMKDIEEKSLQNVFSRAELVLQDLERYTSRVGRRLNRQSVEAELIRRLSISLTRLSYEQENNRRKLETLVRELWWFTEAYRFEEYARRLAEETPKNITRESLGNSTEAQPLRRPIQPASAVFKDKLRGYKRSISLAMDRLRASDNLDDDRLAMSYELGNLVQKRLRALQNPSNCSAARFLICPKKSCGFGCVLHHQAQCLIMAYATERILVFSDDELENNAHQKPSFKPILETCYLENVTSLEKRKSQPFLGSDNGKTVLMYTIIENAPEESKKLLPLAVPADLAPKLALFHGNPAAWWVGQIVAYIMRPTPEYQQELNELRERLDLEDFYVAIHVRRTDKILEAAYHEMEEYMQHVQDYFELLETPTKNQRVFMASDEDLLEEAQAKFPLYRFIRNSNVSRERYSLDGLRGLATDVYFLSRSRYLVCTFSSQVCRLAYELMQTLHGDASSWFRSLDDIYYFGGQADHLVRAVEPSEEGKAPDGEIVMGLEKGDLIRIAGNHWNGYSKGTHTLTRMTALYPTYKTEEMLQYACLPDYPEVYTNSNNPHYI